MKYCCHCGKELQDSDFFCRYCGKVQPSNNQQSSNQTSQNVYGPNIYTPNSTINQYAFEIKPYAGNTLGLVSMGLGCTVPIAGIVCGIMAINKAGAAKNKLGKILGILGIVLSAIAWLFNIIMIM